MSFLRNGLLLSLLAATLLNAQDVRKHTRPAHSGTSVTESQASDLTLTVTKASVRSIQTWVRTSGAIDKTGQILTAYLAPHDAALMKVGQRVRAFPPSSKSSMYQAKITKVLPQGNRTLVEATLGSSGREGEKYYVLEIVVDQGDFFSVPNEAIIEEGDKQVVYVEKNPGQYEPQEIHTKLQGELYTEVLDGLKEGDSVVTFGSFFIDAEYKLK